MEHVVDEPLVRRLVLVAVALRQDHRGLLLARGEEQLLAEGAAAAGSVLAAPAWRSRRWRRLACRLRCRASTAAAAEVHPHAVVQVDDVDPRHLTVAPDQVRIDRRDVAVHLRLRHVGAAEHDVVLARLDLDRAVLELEVLHSRLLDGRHERRRAVARNRRLRRRRWSPCARSAEMSANRRRWSSRSTHSLRPGRPYNRPPVHPERRDDAAVSTGSRSPQHPPEAQHLVAPQLRQPYGLGWASHIRGTPATDDLDAIGASKPMLLRRE